MGCPRARCLSPPCYEAIECALILFATRRELPELRRVLRTIDHPALPAAEPVTSSRTMAVGAPPISFLR